MIVLTLLFLLFAFLSAVGLNWPAWSDVLLISLPCALASLWLMWRARPRRGAKSSKTTKEKRLPKKPRASSRRKRRQRPQTTTEFSKDQKWVIIDGSNVMHWKGGEPDIAPVREVLERLKQLGYTPGVMFDANAGYKLLGKYQHDFAFGKLLGLPEERIMVVPKGTPADPYILTAARDFDAQIVTNDQFREWTGDYPEIGKAGFLISGGYRSGKLELKHS